MKEVAVNYAFVQVQMQHISEHLVATIKKVSNVLDSVLKCLIIFTSNNTIGEWTKGVDRYSKTRH